MEVIAVLAILALLFSKQSQGGTVTEKSVPGIVKTSAWRRYDALFQKYGAQYGVPWQWLKAFSLTESLLGTDPLTSKGLVSSDGKSWGIMQVTLYTAVALGAGPIQGPALNDPDLSVRLAAKLVRELYDQFKGDPRAVALSYNAGPSNFLKGRFVSEYWERWNRWFNVVRDNP